MFSETAWYYDKIYQSMKDYGAKAEQHTAIIRERQSEAYPIVKTKMRSNEDRRKYPFRCACVHRRWRLIPQ